jgi:hypothetical protein
MLEANFSRANFSPYDPNMLSITSLGIWVPIVKTMSEGATKLKSNHNCRNTAQVKLETFLN